MLAKLTKAQKAFFNDRANVTTMDRMFPFNFSITEKKLHQMVWNLERKGFVSCFSTGVVVRVSLTPLGRELYEQGLLD